MIKLLFKLSILLFSIQLTAQSSNGILSGTGKLVSIKTDFYINDELVESEKVELNAKCNDYFEFLEGGVLITQEYYDDCDEIKSEPGTYQYIKNGFYSVTQSGETYDFKVKISDDEMQLILRSKDENGEELKNIAHFKRYDSF